MDEGGPRHRADAAARPDPTPPGLLEQRPATAEDGAGGVRRPSAIETGNNSSSMTEHDDGDTNNDGERSDTGTNESSAAPQAPSPPPFWSTSPSAPRPVSYQSLHGHHHPSSLSGHGRDDGSSSGGPIHLEDHSEETHVAAQSCWAESATVDEHVVVSGGGGATGIGAYVVWHCTVKTLQGGDLAIRKRYSEFDALRGNLVRSFPHAEAMIPELPRKSVVSRFRPEFLEARRRGLGHFLNCILLNPEFASSPVLKEFVFS